MINQLKPKFLGDEKVGFGSLNKTTWVFGAITFLFMILYGVHSANISFFVMEKELGSPAVVGTIMAVCTLGGMLGGATFGAVNKIFKTYTFAAAFFLLAISLVITIKAPNITVLLIGALLCGCSISWDIPQSMLSITNTNRVEAAAVACSVAHIGGQIGTFCSSLVMTNITSVFSQSVSVRYAITAAISAACGVIVILIIKAMKLDKQ